MSQLELLATCAFGLESIVKRELAELGYEAEVVQPGRVLFHGDGSAICRANLWLRCADRVLLRLGTFTAVDFGELFDRTHALPWQEWLAADATFPVNGRSIKSQLSSVPACQKIVKKAIVEKLRAAHAVETLPETGPKYSIEVALLKDEATLTIDTTGPSLHKRGYRKLVGTAPIKETLAAAMVLLSFWKPERPLLDPFCGSGTIPIEAALIGRRLAPGLHRDFDAEQWPAIDPQLWSQARDEAWDLALPSLPARIVATDADEEMLSLARYHARQAGVVDDIHFQHKRFSDLASRKDYGCLIANPPYGSRLGRDREIEALYRSMPEVLRRLPTWSHSILTSHEEFERLLGQPADKRRKLYNARIECTLYQYYGPKPGHHLPAAGASTVAAASRPGKVTGASSPSVTEDIDTGAESTIERAGVRNPGHAAPAFGGVTAKMREQAELFANRLRKRARHLRRWPTRQGITCYRLYERDIPEVPLLVDRYETRLHMAEFERPHDRTPAEHADWLDLMIRTAAETLEVPREWVYLKQRRRLRGADQYQAADDAEPIQFNHLADPRATFVAHEGGLKFEVNLADYVDTGLFLDHRLTRGIVREAASGTRFLNLFAYTGSFSVYAASGGARQSVTVDWSNTYLEW
ncbi:MAG: bifunctional 23S rRNA (guanine(2069)-N(7))-methyltransferase RlmK/23S rRNA (guanine(2445)-N(2))-methyltransferase RlmL, partial [Pirellulales bacterium]